jgi:hypothetical protein
MSSRLEFVVIAINRATAYRLVRRTMNLSQAAKEMSRIGALGRRRNAALGRELIACLTTEPVDIDKARTLAFSLKNGKARQPDGNPSPAKRK